VDAGTNIARLSGVAEIRARMAAPVWCREEAKKGHKSCQRFADLACGRFRGKSEVGNHVAALADAVSMYCRLGGLL
jgi:hypothetical protein